jgi:hypothetical protein
MTHQEQAEKLVHDMIDAHSARGNGTWHLWECRDKFKEVTVLIAAGLAAKAQPSHDPDL